MVLGGTIGTIVAVGTVKKVLKKSGKSKRRGRKR